MRRLAALAGAAALVAGCGSSAPKSPPDLLFVSSRDGSYAIYGARADGSGVRRLTPGKGDASSPETLFFQTDPAWSPDGSQIVFASRREGTQHLFVMKADGSGARRLTSSAMDDSQPDWSPDGRTIVFDREGALFAVPAAGGHVHRVGHGFGSAEDPAWSSDGKLIAYDYRRPGYSIREIWLMRADGTHQQELTHIKAVSAEPAWSPDGKRIAYRSNVHPPNLELYSIGVDGNGIRQETSVPVDTIDPAYAPGGALSFSRDGSIWTRNANGKALRLTPSGNDASPAWRPRA